MAKPPWARLTKPIRPIVMDRPTETMKSTMPAATPPRRTLATSAPTITGRSGGGRCSSGPAPAEAGGAVLLFPRLHEALVLRVLEIGVVVVHRDQTDRRGTHGLQLGVLGDVAGADQPDAGLAHSQRGVGLHHGGGMVAGRHEHEEHVGLLVLGALEEGREVGHRAGAAHRDLVHHLAAVALEGALERGEAVLA